MRVLLCPASAAKACLEATSEVFEQGVCPFLAKVQTLEQFETEIALAQKYTYSTQQALHRGHQMRLGSQGISSREISLGTEPFNSLSGQRGGEAHSTPARLGLSSARAELHPGEFGIPDAHTAL